MSGGRIEILLCGASSCWSTGFGESCELRELWRLASQATGPVYQETHVIPDMQVAYKGQMGFIEGQPMANKKPKSLFAKGIGRGANNNQQVMR